jgi:hypothetical protein
MRRRHQKEIPTDKSGQPLAVFIRWKKIFVL